MIIIIVMELGESMALLQVRERTSVLPCGPSDVACKRKGLCATVVLSPAILGRLLYCLNIAFKERIREGQPLCVTGRRLVSYIAGIV